MPSQRGRGLLVSKQAKASSRPQNSRGGFKGERHARLKTTKGFRKANFMGPGTNVVARLKRGDQPINYMDGVSKIHDIDYSLARSAADVRKADLRMIARAKRAQKLRLDFPFNMVLGKWGIKAKVGLEKVGLPKDFFTKFGGASLSAGDTALLKRERGKAVQQGYGRLAASLGYRSRPNGGGGSARGVVRF